MVHWRKERAPSPNLDRLSDLKRYWWSSDLGFLGYWKEIVTRAISKHKISSDSTLIGSLICNDQMAQSMQMEMRIRKKFLIFIKLSARLKALAIPMSWYCMYLTGSLQISTVCWINHSNLPRFMRHYSRWLHQRRRGGWFYSRLFSVSLEVIAAWEF